MVRIPESMKAKYKQLANDLIDYNVGITCTLYYPPKRVECSECSTGQVGGGSAGKFDHGGPNFYPNSKCNNCDNLGYKEVPQTDTIKLRVYFSPKDFVKIGNHQLNDETIQVIGKMSDISKFEKAQEVKITTGALTCKAVKRGSTQSHGLNDQWFISYMDRVK